MSTDPKPILTLDQLTAAEESLFSAPSPEGYFHTAELEDEDAPDGMVVIRDREGNPTAWMSRAAFDGFVKAQLEKAKEASYEEYSRQAIVRGSPLHHALMPGAASHKNRHQRRAEAAKKRRGKR